MKQVFISRSHIDSRHRCPRMRYFSYHLPVMDAGEVHEGIYRKGINFDLLNGIALHHGVEGMMRRVKEEGLNGQTFIKEILSARKIVQDKVLEVLYERGEGDAQLEWQGEEAGWLVYALLKVFARTKSGLPGLVERYEIVDVEKEEEPRKFGEGKFSRYDGSTGEETFEVLLGGRADAILRDKSTGDLIILSLKSTGAWDARKENLGRTDMQGLSESWLVRERTGENVEGVQYLYLMKGSRKEKNGIYSYDNTLIHPYKEKGSTLYPEYKERWAWVDPDTGAKRSLHYSKWEATNIWEEELGLDGWIEELATRSKGEWDDVSPLEDYIVLPEVYYRSAKDINDWVVSTSKGEVGFFSNMLSEQELAKVGGGGVDINQFTEMHRHSCTYPSKCQFFSVCHESDSLVNIDPIGMGYKGRVPHHEMEMRVRRGEIEDA